MYDVYLGDGVYASFDGFHVVLDLRAQNDSRIALDPPTLQRLTEYAHSVWTKETNDEYSRISREIGWS